MADSPLNAAAGVRLPRHAPTIIFLHWLTTLLVALLWGIGQTVDAVPQGPWRVDYRSLHIVLGVALGVVLVVRLIWRATRGGVLPTLDHGIRLAAAHAIHWALYALMAATIALGIVYAWARGEALFNVIPIHSFAPDDRALRRAIGGYHELAANAVLIVAGLHALAALAHHHLLGDATLRRMLPWNSR